MLFLDIGGEGRHANAWNVNPSPVKTLGRDRGSPIPNWIPGRASKLPFPDRVVDLIIVERTPILREAVLELMRVVALDGVIILRHFHGSGSHPHEFARATIGGKCTTRTITIGNQNLQETRFELGRVFADVAPACQLNFGGYSNRAETINRHELTGPELPIAMNDPFSPHSLTGWSRVCNPACCIDGLDLRRWPFFQLEYAGAKPPCF